MLLSHKKNIGHAITGKRTLLFLLFFLPACLQAQMDTAILPDSLVPEIIETPAAEQPPAEVLTGDSEKNEFFVCASKPRAELKKSNAHARQGLAQIHCKATLTTLSRCQKLAITADKCAGSSTKIREIFSSRLACFMQLDALKFCQESGRNWLMVLGDGHRKMGDADENSTSS